MRSSNIPPHYTIYEDGRIYTSKYKRFLKPSTCERYRRVSIVNIDGEIKHQSIHRLVAKAFIPNPYNKSEVNHINGVKHDNRVSNLEWATSNENKIHAYTTGLSKIKRIINIEKNIIYDSARLAAQSIDVSRQAILGAIRNNGTSKGYHWTYA